MGWALYLVNKTKNVVINAGKVQEPDFMLYVDQLRKIDPESYYLEGIQDQPISTLTLEQSRQVYRLVDLAQLYTSYSINLVAALLYLRWEDEGDELQLAVDPKTPNMLDL